jgi:hypothetical protein
MKTQTEIVIETIQFYLADPDNRRSVSEQGCHYVIPGEPSRHCAVGRCMTPDALRRHGHILGNVHGLVRDAGARHLDDLLQAEYRGHPVTFWQDLQVLHDYLGAWTGGENAARTRGIFVRDRLPDALAPCIALGLVADPAATVSSK